MDIPTGQQSMMYWPPRGRQFESRPKRSVERRRRVYASVISWSRSRHFLSPPSQAEGELKLVIRKPARSLTILLQAAAQNRADLSLEDFRESQIRWAVESGLGPLLRRCVANASSVRMSPLWPLLEGANVTARMIMAEQMDAMEEIVRACGSHAHPPTLLKGISISDQFYPEPHLRPMRDIDFLVEQDAIPVVESALLGMGYRQQSENPPEFYEAHHHTTPFYHPRTRVWVEVHQRLFPVWSPVGSDKVFSIDNVRTERRPAEFRGRPVDRLSDELQVVYLASHWAIDFRRLGGMVAMFDMIYLLRNARSIRWNRILEWLDGAVAAGPMYLLLTYLARHELVELPPGILGDLFRQQRSFGPASLKIVHALIDRYVTNGREFGLLVSDRNFKILWETLLLPRRASRRLPLVLWNLLPSRVGLIQLLRGYARRGNLSNLSFCLCACVLCRGF
jgi:hypothetical protein